KRLDERFKTSPDDQEEVHRTKGSETELAAGWMTSGATAHQVLTPRFVTWAGIIHGMISVPETFPDDPILLKQLLLSLHEQMSSKDKEITAKDGQIEHLREQNALLIRKRSINPSYRLDGVLLKAFDGFLVCRIGGLCIVSRASRQFV
ncbi:hypothetical protein ACK9U2_004285, partial [Pseudomonas putida]